MEEEAFSVIRGLNSFWQQAVQDGPLASRPAVHAVPQLEG